MIKNQNKTQQNKTKQNKKINDLLAKIIRECVPSGAGALAQFLIFHGPDGIQPHRLQKLPHLEPLMHVLLIRDPVTREEPPVVMVTDVAARIREEAEDGRGAGEAGRMHRGAAIIAGAAVEKMQHD